MDMLFYRYGSICEPYIIDTFKRLNINVLEENSSIRDKDQTPLESFNKVKAFLEKGGIGFVFSIDFFPWLSDACQIYKITYISLIVDSPVMELYSNSIRNSVNKIFIFDSEQYKEFYKENPKGIFYCPLATSVLHNDNVIAAMPKERKDKYACDVSFIGSLYTEKCDYNLAKLPPYADGYAKGLIEAQLKVYGYNFIEECMTDDFVEVFMKNAPMYQFPENSRVDYKAVIAQKYLSVKVSEQERIRAMRLLAQNFKVDIYTGSDTSDIKGINNKGFANSMNEMPVIFNQSKININITSKSIRSGIPLRVFDVLGSGGFLLTNYQTDLPEVFEIGKDLECYTSFEEMVDKVRYYLSHEEERTAIAKNGYEKVKKLHTYDIRILQILDAAFPQK